MKKSADGLLVGTGCLTIILMLIFMPIVTYWCGYFGGWILMNFVGNSVASVINTILGRSDLTADMLPVFFGGLAIIANYFKSTQTNNNNNK